MSRPQYIYKILPHSSVDPRFTFPTPIPASFELTLPQLDHDDGFVHTSSAAQVPDTLRFFFKNVEAIWILRMDVGRLSAWREIDWLEGSGVTSTEKAPQYMCAHLRRPWLKGEEIESVKAIAREGDGWASALTGDEIKGWLV